MTNGQLPPSVLYDAIAKYAPRHSTVAKSAFTLPMLQWVYIPAGNVTIEFGKWEYVRGSKYRYVTERKETYLIEAFHISKYPVTNLQYEMFVDAQNGYRNVLWWDYSQDAQKVRDDNKQPKESGFKDNKRPPENVTWYDAIAFCRWLSHKTSLSITLPTEQQWQRAAQGDTNWIYPWGDVFDVNKCNTSESGIFETTDVDRYGKNGRGFSPYGVYDLSGNVEEWCLNADDIDNIDINWPSITLTQVRGGSWSYFSEGARVMARSNSPAGITWHKWLGFRLVSSTPHNNPR